MARLFRDLAGDRGGVTLIEYALIAGLVSLLCVGFLAALGTSLKSFYFTTVEGALASA